MQAANKFTYDLESVTKNVPPSSGVFSIYSRGECVYVGESDDVCAGLLEIYFEDNPRLNAKDLTHFTYDLVAPELRAALQNHRIQELRPVCNVGPEAADQRQPRTPPEEGEVGRMAALGAPSR